MFKCFFFGKDENVWLWGYLLSEHYLNMCLPIGKTCLNFRVHQRQSFYAYSSEVAT